MSAFDPKRTKFPLTRVALLPYRFAAAGRRNPEGTERDDQNRALWIMCDRHGPTTPVRLVAGQTGGRHHQMRKPLGSRMRDNNVGEIVSRVIPEIYRSWTSENKT